jgi:amino acid transporter
VGTPAIRSREHQKPRAHSRNAIYVSIVAATLLYVLVAVVTTNLVPASTIQQQPDTALAIAARPFLGSIGFVLISVAALFSTGSALNATLFSAARLSTKMVDDDFLPNELRGKGGGEPTRPLLVIGVLTAGLAVIGSLNAISSFASLSFIVIFGSISALAVGQRDSVVTAVVPGIGAVGATAAATALLYHLYTSEFGTFVVVLALVAGVVAIEVLYFERDVIETEVTSAEEAL